MKNIPLSIRRVLTSLVLPVIFTVTFFICNACVAAPPDHATGIMTSFGVGKIKVTLYSDYFCGPCRSMDSMIDPVIKTLVQNNMISITFIDAPFHKFSSLYAKYFLFILKEKNDFNYALSARGILFDMAKENLTEAEKIEEYLKKKGIKIKQFDIKPVFSVFENNLKLDNINSTPTCVIERNGKKEIFKGRDDILKSLENIKL
jgi:protein-disulfide isomerase